MAAKCRNIIRLNIGGSITYRNNYHVVNLSTTFESQDELARSRPTVTHQEHPTQREHLFNVWYCNLLGIRIFTDII